MSSTRNSKNLLVSTFRPTYVYDTCGFRASVVMSNIATVDADVVRAGTLAIGDAGGNIYVGSNSGVVYATNPTNFNNVALGVGAAAGISGVSNSVFIGSNAGYLLSNANDTTIIGTNDTVVGTRNVVIGNRDFVYGNNNVIIGSDLSTNESFKLNIANLIIGDIGNDVCGAALIFNSDVRINGVFTSELFDASGVSTTNIAIPGYIRNDPTFGIIMDISEGNFRFSGSSYSRVSDVSFYRGRVDASAGIRGTGFDLSSGLTLTGNISNSGTHTANNFIGTASASNSIGGVTLSNNNVSYSGTITGSTDGASNKIGGVTLSNTNISYAGTMTGSTDSASNKIGGVTLSNTNITYAGVISNSTAGSSNSIGGVTLSNTNVSNVGTMSATNTIVSGYIRNALGPTQFDISGGNISNSATHTASNFIGTATASNSIGGVTLSNTNISYAGTITGTTDSASNKIGGVTLSNTNISNAGTHTSSNFIGTSSASNTIGGVTLSNTNISNAGTTTSSNFVGTSAASNSIGGVTLSNTNISYAGTITGSTDNTSNKIGGVTLSNTNISNAGTTTSSNFVGTSAASNSIGGVTLSNTNISYAGAISNSTTESSNLIGGVTLSNSNVRAGFGNAANPSLTFFADSTMGMYRVGSQALGFSVGGSNRMTICGDRISINTSNAITRFQVNPTISVAAVKTYDSSAAMIVQPKPTSTTVLNDATPVLYLGREGTAAQAYGSLATLNLCRWENNSVNSRTRMDFALTHDAFNDVNIMSLRSDGRVGIGTTTPLAPLHIEGGSIIVQQLGNIANGTDTAMIVEGSSNVGMYIQKGSNNNNCGVSFKTLSNNTFAERMRIDANTGRVGIGTTAPEHLLDVYGSGTGNTTTLRVSSGVGGSASASNIAQLRLTSRVGTGAILDYNIRTDEFAANNYGLTFGGYVNSNAVRMDFGNTRLGIGTVAPIRTLDVSGSIGVQQPITSVGGANYLEMLDISAGVGSRRVGLGIYNPSTGSLAGGDFVINTYNDSGGFYDIPMLIKRSNGFVGLGIQTPSNRLEVASNVAASAAWPLYLRNSASLNVANTVGIRFGPSAESGTGQAAILSGFDKTTTAGVGYLGFQTFNGTIPVERLRIDSVGNVGIGTTNPAYTLDVSAPAGTAAINVDTWPRTTASVCYRGRYSGTRSSDALFLTTIQSMDSNLIAVVDNCGTYFTVKKTGIYAITCTMNGSATSAWGTTLDASTSIAHNTVNYAFGMLSAAGATNATGAQTLAFTGVLPSNDTNYYKWKITSGMTPVTSGCTMNIVFLGEAPTVASVPY